MLTKADVLRVRINIRKLELLTRYAELKRETQLDAIEARAKVKLKLDELEANLHSGWDNVTEAVRGQLTKWLDN